MVYCVVSVGKWKRNVIFCGEGLRNGSVMLYYTVRFGKVQRDVYCVVSVG
jgi:hypothetical protein